MKDTLFVCNVYIQWCTNVLLTLASTAHLPVSVPLPSWGTHALGTKRRVTWRKLQTQCCTTPVACVSRRSHMARGFILQTHSMLVHRLLTFHIAHSLSRRNSGTGDLVVISSASLNHGVRALLSQIPGKPKLALLCQMLPLPHFVWSV